MLERITIEIPPHLEEVAEEILAYVKESRYSDATDLWAKTKQEVSEIMQQVRNEQNSELFNMGMPRPQSHIGIIPFFIILYIYCHSVASTKNQSTKNSQKSSKIKSKF
jgi:hypothetical protein